MSEHQEPTPAELRVLMGQADALAERILDIHRRLRASEETRHSAFRLEDAAGEVRRVGEALSETASDLVRTRTARDANLCDVPWGACPDHGNTLRATAGRSWCTDPGCSRSWQYDRLGNACGEPVTHEVTDLAGATLRTCKGHALDAGRRLEGATVTVIPAGGPDAGEDHG